MAFKRWLISAFLAALALFFAIQAVRVWTAPAADALGDLEHAQQPRTVLRSRPIRRVPPLQSFRVIAERNLFSPARRRSSTTGELSALPMDRSQGANKIILLGVVIQADDRKALVKQNRRGTREEESWVRVGDRIDQMQVVGIEAERIILQEGQQVYRIKISDRAETRPTRTPIPRMPVKKPEIAPPAQQPIIVDKPRPSADQPPTQEKPQ